MRILNCESYVSHNTKPLLGFLDHGGRDIRSGDVT